MSASDGHVENVENGCVAMSVEVRERSHSHTHEDGRALSPHSRIVLTSSSSRKMHARPAPPPPMPRWPPPPPLLMPLPPSSMHFGNRLATYAQPPLPPPPGLHAWHRRAPNSMTSRAFMPKRAMAPSVTRPGVLPAPAYPPHQRSLQRPTWSTKRETQTLEPQRRTDRERYARQASIYSAGPTISSASVHRSTSRTATSGELPSVLRYVGVTSPPIESASSTPKSIWSTTPLELRVMMRRVSRTKHTRETLPVQSNQASAAATDDSSSDSSNSDDDKDEAVTAAAGARLLRKFHALALSTPPPSPPPSRCDTSLCLSRFAVRCAGAFDTKRLTD